MLAKTDAEAVRAQNRRVVIDHLRRAGRTTRRAASEATSLSMSSASAIAAELIRGGVLVEDEDGRTARRGRPEMGLRLDGRAARVAAARLSVGALAVQIADYEGRPLGHASAERDISGFSAAGIVALLAALVGEALAACGAGPPLSRIVVAVQGMTDSAGRRILWSPALKGRDLDLADALGRETGAAAVEVLNDCSLMPEAFRWKGDFGREDFATLFIGFGVGMGLRLEGRTFQGRRSSAVEFGHLNHWPGGALCRCGHRGCVEAYAGDYAILRRAAGRPADEVPGRRISDAEMLALAGSAREGPGPAREAFIEAGLAIGYGLGRIFSLIDPLPILFTGSGAHAMDLLEPAIRQGIAMSAVAGLGADVPFTLAEDVDALVFEAATVHALVRLDEQIARSGVVEGRDVAA